LLKAITKQGHGNKVLTVGCRLNQAEGDILRSFDFDRNRNTIIVNTCAVTQEAVRTSWKTIRRNIANKTKDTQLIVTGCLATLEQNKMLGYSGIDKVITQDQKVKLISSAPVLTNNFLKRSRPIIKVQDGCPNRCAFCIASVIRGYSRSIPVKIVIDNINKLIRQGYEEIVLTGLNLGAYGFDINSSLVELLKNINTDSYRVRLSSIQPDTITDQMLDLWQSKKICRHLHIPLQSGDDRILKLMERKYTVDDYCRLINKVSKKIKGVNIGTDIIVGFPYEDELAFNNTIKIVEQLPFGYLHVFPYSTRPGTQAALLPDKIPVTVKKERVRILRKIGEQKKARFREQFINKSLPVIAEDNDRGLTDNYLSVALDREHRYEKGKAYNILIKE
jgi:threonylcarbamoyladenosine tRNA methylthiotransferase MtaB